MGQVRQSKKIQLDVQNSLGKVFHEWFLKKLSSHNISGKVLAGLDKGPKDMKQKVCTYNRTNTLHSEIKLWTLK